MNRGNCRLKTGQEVRMKTFKKTATAAILIILTLFLITCVPEPPGSSEPGENNIEWLDWKYEDNPDGSGRLTLMLDGSTPFAYNKQERGLNVEMAKMIHDYFEAVFVHDTNIRRTTWEIGYPAGISGLDRDENYGPVYADGTSGTASVVFVGKKQGKTLLGIGHLVQVNEGAKILDDGITPPGNTNTTTITDNATSVTYAVYPFITKVGWTPGTPDVWNVANTFMTDVSPTTGLATGTVAAPTGGGSSGKLIELPGNVKYPLFDLPAAPTAAGAETIIKATYTIALPGNAPAPYPNPPESLFNSARIITIPVAGDPPGTLGLEVIKRYAAYQVQGQTFDASKSLDVYTRVVTTSNQGTGAAFSPVIDITITQTVQSAGIFAITFQCPVYAITGAPSNLVSGTPKDDAVKWYIRPGYNQYQYLLDNGTDAGGMVMLGKLDAGSTDWLEIFTVGIGFSN
jgi:hypothetical protein